MRTTIEDRLAHRLAELRTANGWSLDDLAARTRISRSTLSRLERAEISPTAAQLGRLGTAYGKTMSRLLAEVEAEPAHLVRAGDQPLWRDAATGFTRRSVSPPHPGMRGEVVEAILAPGADIPYDEPPVPGLEQHVWVHSGTLGLTAGDETHELRAGDCLRFRVWGRTRFRCLGDAPARYAILVVLP